jgi:signal transduction histidine kinase
MVPINVRSTLQEVIDDVRSEYTDAAITVEGAIPQCSIMANDMLDSVFRNLLTNAIQHNDKEVPEVRVTAFQEDETVEVRIADNGP